MPHVPFEAKLLPLTSCVANIFQRIISDRLYDLAESSGWFFFSYQAGFCKVRNVEDQVLRVVQKISDRLQRKDFSKANDSIWRQLLLHTFPNIGVPGKYFVWLWSFYSLFIYFYRTDRSEFDLRASSEKPGR